MSRAPVQMVVFQHVADAAALHTMRSCLLRAPHANLLRLERLDERLSAHLDGIRVAGELGRRLTLAALESAGPGQLHVATLSAIEAASVNGLDGLDRMFALAQAVPASQSGLFSAFGYCSSQFLQGVAAVLLRRDEAFHRRVGIAACAMHGLYPGKVLGTALNSDDWQLRATALRSAGVLGQCELLAACVEHEVDPDPVCAFAATCSAVYLGARGQSVDRLRVMCRLPGVPGNRAVALGLKILERSEARALLQAWAREPADRRLLLKGIGVAGDPHYVPWLIAQMSDLKLARLAGESFSLITGLDLAYLDLELKPPENFTFGPTNDPGDDNVAMDEDDGLPWPDPAKLQAWWEVNHQRFQPGVRYFMGAPPAVDHCRKVLREGYQRQRVAAAEYLCLLAPGTPLFPTSAPAWRQQRWLRQMG